MRIFYSLKYDVVAGSVKLSVSMSARSQRKRSCCGFWWPT